MHFDKSLKTFTEVASTTHGHWTVQCKKGALAGDVPRVSHAAILTTSDPNTPTPDISEVSGATAYAQDNTNEPDVRVVVLLANTLPELTRVLQALLPGFSWNHETPKGTSTS